LSLSTIINSIIVILIVIIMLPTLCGLSDSLENLKIILFKSGRLFPIVFFKDGEQLSCRRFHGASSAITSLWQHIVNDSSLEDMRKLKSRKSRRASSCSITKRSLIDVIRETSVRISSPLISSPPFRIAVTNALLMIAK